MELAYQLKIDMQKRKEIAELDNEVKNVDIKDEELKKGKVSRDITF